MTYTTIQVIDAGQVRTVVLNRPERRNAMTPEMQIELISSMESAVASSVRVLVFKGAGTAFCSGLDLNMVRTSEVQSETEHRQNAMRLAHLFRTLYELPVPTIAAVHGPAIAGGTGLATLCDFTIATPEAKFGYTEPRIGFVPAIVSAFLSIQVGEKACRDLLVSGRIVDAEEAYRLGLVNDYVPSDQLEHHIESRIQQVMRNSPKSLAAVKRLLSHQHKHTLDMALSLAVDESVLSRTGGDFREGIAALLEKRDPQWAK